MSTVLSLAPTALRLQAVLAGRFSLERELGRGGMAVVYLARDIALDRPVAIKLLSPALAERPDMRARFLREARIAAQCFHPNIVPIHAVETDGDLAWIVMSYVRGETLAERLRRSGPLAAEDVRRLAREVGWALSYAHALGVVHRDVKPENLLIDASTERFLIADFGIALASDQQATNDSGNGSGQGSDVGSRIGAGTARYMAPEQALGETIDGRADLYALGVTLFVAATGRAPFDAPTSVALMVQHASHPAPSVRAYAPRLPLELVRAIDRCLEKAPAARHADANHFLRAIEPDVRAQPLPPAVSVVRNHAAGAEALVGWTLAIGAATLLLLAGEAPGSLGRAILGSVGGGITALFGALAAVRGGEAWVAARRALRRGNDAGDVVRALSGAHEDAPLPSSDASGDGGTRLGVGLAQLGVGAVVAIAQGSLSSLSLPDVVAGLVELGAILVPPVLLARGASNVGRATRIGAWLRRHIRIPLARRTVQALSRDPRQDAASMPADAPTELLLARDVDALHRGLREEQRAAVGDAAVVAGGLAAAAVELRAELERLKTMEATSLALAGGERADALAQARDGQREVQGRLQSTVAALELLRVDLLRLTAEAASGGLTEQLDAVVDMHRHVDALGEVRQWLASSRSDERTPTAS